MTFMARYNYIHDTSYTVWKLEHMSSAPDMNNSNVTHNKCTYTHSYRVKGTGGITVHGNMVTCTQTPKAEWLLMTFNLFLPKVFMIIQKKLVR